MFMAHGLSIFSQDMDDSNMHRIRTIISAHISTHKAYNTICICLELFRDPTFQICLGKKSFSEQKEVLKDKHTSNHRQQKQKEAYGTWNDTGPYFFLEE